MTRVLGPALALAALALHLVTASRYGYFRDELYFIACAQHLAWGYVDQPPLVALAAWLAMPWHFALPVLRALPIVAAALTVLAVIALVRELGGGVFARFAAGALTFLLPAYLLLGNTLTTTSFEPLTWTLATYCAVRLVRTRGAWRWWLAIAIVIAFGLYAKYSIALLAAALAAGLLLTQQRSVLRTWRPFAAIAIALLLVAPNLAWQAFHGWPIVEVLRGDASHRPAFQNGIALEYANTAKNALAFIVEQLLYANPFAAPIWILGVLAPFTVPSLRDMRFVSAASMLALAVAAIAGAKGYYVIGIYGPLLALGCVWLESFPAFARSVLAAAAIAFAVLAMPFAIPVLSLQRLLAYEEALHLTSRSQPRLLQPVFAEELGWERLARDVARVYVRLPSAQRASTAVYADTYGDAGALDLYGPRYGLPPAVSSQNSYFLWGPGPRSRTVVIAVGATRIDLLRAYYRSVRLVATSFDPDRWIVEGPAPIYLCTGAREPLAKIWPHLRWYGA